MLVINLLTAIHNSDHAAGASVLLPIAAATRSAVEGTL